MIPYFYLPTINLGFFSINTWGLFAALGFALAIFIAIRHGRCRGQNAEIILDLSFWMIIAAIIGARLAHVFFYNWEFFKENPLEIFKIWHGGLAFYGGFIGAGAVAAWYFWQRRLEFFSYADTFIFSLPAGLFIGRIGCFLIHDHPGTLTHFILGVKYPDGGIRHDLGLYLGIFDILLFGAFLVFEKTNFRKIWFKNNPPDGFYLAAFSLTYGVARFFLDFLRAFDLPGSDARYGVLTPAQYASILLFAFGVYLALKLKNKINFNHRPHEKNLSKDSPNF